MRFPSFKRLTKQDYSPEEQGFVEKLSFVINNSFEVLFEALNNKLSFRDNLACTIRELLIQVDSSGSPVKGTSAQFSFSTAVEGILVLSAFNATNSQVYPTGGIFISYSTSDKSVLINNVTGLQAGSQYRIKIAILGQ